MDQLEAIVAIASDLTSALSSEERHARLLAALGRVIPYDAAALLRLEQGALVPVAAEGLSEGAMGRRFALEEHPRLEIICRSEGPITFPPGSELPDPFDGLLALDRGEFQRVHACLGCPLRVGDRIIGALTADAVSPRAFEEIEPSFLSAVGALAAAEMQTTHLIEALEESARRQGLIARDLMRDLQLRQGADMIGTTPVMQRLRRDIELVARSDLTVLVMGETGVGKELVARALHAASDRRDEPMLYVNCAALPETLAESELFGHLRGSFTGATADRSGKFEVADRGTLFLDEIGELPMSVQPKLLRAIQQGEIQRLGSDKTIKADVRLIAATNRDLVREVKAGRFRADLFHRLNVYPLRVPALRERADDIPLLAGYFCDVTRRRLGLGPVRLDPEATSALKRHPWPGNVRELENTLARISLRAAARVPRASPVVITLPDLGPEFTLQGAPGAFAAPDVPWEGPPGSQGPSGSQGQPGPPGQPGSPEPPLLPMGDLKTATRTFQRSLIERALYLHEGNWSAAARSLGMHRSNLHHLAVRLGLKERR
ncbi:MAG: nitric oxide reductase transcriptional regulator NorR [Polyangia bacterium]|jgi:anaerobic nitric oxide reductase transcription regulator|nr:nitric oxide reductase transcriptional regulator NorR [Polyangia bacterium]